MEDIITAQERILDTILLEDKFQFEVYITIGLVKGNDFQVILEFLNLQEEDFKEVAKLTRIKKALKFNSEIANKEGYKISHIVITNFKTNSNFEMTWECLSDSPDLIM